MQKTYHRQAVIITAFRNLTQLIELAKILSEVFEVYIHIDKKVSDAVSKVNTLKNMNHVKVYSLYKVNWGGCKHLKAILYLINEALKNENIDFFHIISGEDWPVQNAIDIYERFENEDKIYMNFKELSKMKKKEYWHVGGWQKYYSFLDIFDYKKIPQKLFVKGFVYLQKLLRINRFKELKISLSRGVIWGDLPRKAIVYCFQYAYGNPEFLNFLEYGHASEKFFFQTILLNSADWKDKMVNNNLRYIVYERRNGSYPAVLDQTDYKQIIQGGYIFARKLRTPVSDELISNLMRYTHGMG